MAAFVIGSSPRTRGTFVGGTLGYIPVRFIPAYAGNMRAMTHSTVATAVHPRVRGEHFFSIVDIDGKYGSSPRTRGTLTKKPPSTRLIRFIPAYAGNIEVHQTRVDRDAVHPRVRGEHRKQRWQMRLTGGSSPRTRGTFALTVFSHFSGRFIPAYAGNMDAGVCERRGEAVHPRVRGEHLWKGPWSQSILGSSPRTRGTY